MTKEKTNQSFRRSVLLLFPWKSLGERVTRAFLGEDFLTLVVTFDDRIEKHFSSLSKANARQPVVLRPGNPPQPSESELTGEMKDAMFRAQVVVYFAGTDFIQMKSEGDLENWQIDLAARPQLKLAFVDYLLKQLDTGTEKLWFNIAYGMGAKEKDGATYCKTRYGMTGFARLLELKPSWPVMSVVNICLTYFFRGSEHSEMMHCSNCMSETLRDALVTVDDEQSVADYLTRRVRTFLGPLTQR